MKRIFIILIMISMILAAFGGCEKDDSQEYESQGPVAVYDPEEPVTVVLAEFQNNEERSEALRLIADKYEYDHPNVTIEIVSFPQSIDEGLALLQADTDIDIYEINHNTASAYINAGHAADITDYLVEADDMYTLTIAANWTMYYHDGKYAYFVPSSIYTKALYYRADLVEKHEISIPRFFYTVEEYGLQMMENDEVEYGLVLPLDEENRYQTADYFIWSHIGMEQIADIGNAYFVEDDSSKTIFSLPEAETALATLKMYYEQLGPQDALELDDEAAAQIFADGDAFMTIADSRGVSIVEGALDDEDWVVYPLPLGATDQGNTGILSNEYEGWSIYSGSDHEEVAGAFLMYLSTADNNTYLARITNCIPIHSNAIELDSYYSDSHFSGYQMLADKAAIGLYHYVQAPTAYKAFLEYEANINQRYESFFKGEIDAKTLLNELDAYWSKAYEEEGQLWESTPIVEDSEASE